MTPTLTVAPTVTLALALTHSLPLPVPVPVPVPLPLARTQTTLQHLLREHTAGEAMRLERGAAALLAQAWRGPTLSLPLTLTLRRAMPG